MLYLRTLIVVMLVIGLCDVTHVHGWFRKQDHGFKHHDTPSFLSKFDVIKTSLYRDWFEQPKEKSWPEWLLYNCDCLGEWLSYNDKHLDMEFNTCVRYFKQCLCFSIGFYILYWYWMNIVEPRIEGYLRYCKRSNEMKKWRKSMNICRKSCDI